jgi:hypothetical protein
MSAEISVLVFVGVFNFIFAMKTVDAPFAFVFYTITTSVCFALAVKFVLER